jgi:nicotinate-nucleotide pyrophosphorylase (carboxylating)
VKAPKLDRRDIAAIVKVALEEDLGKGGDVTSRSTVPAKARIKLAMNARQDIVVCGMPVAEAVVKKMDPRARFKIEKKDGTFVKKGTRLAVIEGNARALLTAERTALNIVQFLSAISTLTRQYAEQVKGTGCTLLDIRKTVPGLRNLSKYATRMGGATNHRMRLDDGVLIKDNHLQVGGGLKEVVRKAKQGTKFQVQVECDTLAQVKAALEAGADRILLDNMDTAQLKKAVKLVQGRVPLEASGGITLENVRERAKTGVDFVSTGKITQSAGGVDIGMDLID